MTTKDKIVQAAVQLFVEQGVAETTTREIAQSASVAEGSIYRYFPSKDELAWQVFRDYHEALAQALQNSISIEQTLDKQINALINCFFEHADSDWWLFRYYLTSQHTHMHKITNDVLTPYQVIVGVIEQAINNKQINTDNLEMTAAMAMGAVHQIAINKHYGRIEGDLKQYCPKVSRGIFHLVTSHE